MGVISNGSNPFASLVEDLDDNFGIEVEVISSHDEEEDQNLINHLLARQARRAPRRHRDQNPARPMNFALTPKHMGAKKHRRYNNAMELMTFAGLSADDFDEVTIYDFVPSGISAFAKLLEKPDNMKLWQDFINCSEDEQHCVLMGQRRPARFASGVQKTKQLPAVEDAPARNKKKTDCPVHSPDDCFRKISSRIRALLKRNRYSMDALPQIESQVTDFFIKSPREVYVSKLPSSHDRLILHGLCQYLDLISHSYNAGGERLTRVKNHKGRDTFCPPPVLLSAYIMEHL